MCIRDREIVSHEQALSQCEEYLKKLGADIKITPVENTAVAAQMVACLLYTSTEYGLCYTAFHTIEHRLTYTCRKPFYNTFNYDADRIAFR